MLAGANTYWGGTTINSGTLSISSTSNLSDEVGGVTLNAGTLQTTGSLTTARAVTLRERRGDGSSLTPARRSP